MATLWQSCFEVNLQAAKTELERGADVNFCYKGSTCLILAVASQNEELVSLLLGQPGLELNAIADGTPNPIPSHPTKQTALHIAGQYSSPAIIRMLLDFPGIDREAKNSEGRSPLINSILEGGDIAQVNEFFLTPGMHLQ